MYGYNAGPPTAIPIYTVLPYCVITVKSGEVIIIETHEFELHIHYNRVTHWAQFQLKVVETLS